MASDLELLDSSERDLEWFQQNSLDIREKFANKIVAIKDKEVIADARNINDLILILKEKGIDETEVLIEFIVPKNEIVILDRLF